MANTLLGDASRLVECLGEPAVPPQQIIAWMADWVLKGGTSIGKPTQYEARDGAF